MRDSSHLANVAEDLIAHHLQRTGLLVAKPKNDRLGTDLIVFAQIADGVKFCRVQCKGRTVSKSGTSITIPIDHVTPGYLLFVYLTAGTDNDGLYYFSANAIRTWKRSGTKNYRLAIKSAFREHLAPWRFSAGHVAQIKTIIERAELSGEFRFVAFAQSNVVLSNFTSSGTVTAIKK